MTRRSREPTNYGGGIDTPFGRRVFKTGPSSYKRDKKRREHKYLARQAFGTKTLKRQYGSKPADVRERTYRAHRRKKNRPVFDVLRGL